MPQLGDDVERQAKAILGDDEFNRIKNKYLDNEFVDEFYLDLDETIGRDFNRGDGLETYRVWKQSKKNRYLADQELPDEYPHKEFVPVVVKDTIAKAILGDDEFNRIKNKYLDNEFVDEFYLDLDETIGRDFNDRDWETHHHLKLLLL